MAGVASLPTELKSTISNMASLLSGGVFIKIKHVVSMCGSVCRPGVWHKAKKVVLSTGQTEVKVDFPLPIVACNLMVEYADFYDNLQVLSLTAMN